MKRRAPENGYDFDEKHEYRKHIWRSFKRWLPIHPCNAHALLMPSSEGIEIDVAKSFGFLEEHLHIVDDNPAIVASLKRRYPKVHTYGVDIVRAFERIRKKGQMIACANLDFTGCVSAPLLKKMYQIGKCYVMGDGGLVAINVLRGRERPTMTSDMEFLEACDRAIGLTELMNGRMMGHHRITARDVSRVAEMFEHLCVREGMSMSAIWEPKMTGVYRSTAGNQTMLWVVSEVRQFTTALDERSRLLDQVYNRTKHIGKKEMKEYFSIAPAKAIGGRFGYRKDGRDKKIRKLDAMSHRAMVRTVALALRQWLTDEAECTFDELREGWEILGEDRTDRKALVESGLWEYGKELFASTTACHD